ncbi:MAG: glycosyltransferase, partial [Bdellovibrionota bacterium]
MISDKPLVFVPTYNERENVQNLVSEILALGLDLDLLLMDDNSPDGTGRIIDELALKYPNIKTVHRSGKLGVGSAHYDGIGWAYEHGYSRLITMDCDFTHPPRYIKEILAGAGDAAVKVGSRYMQGGSLAGWNLFRTFLTKTGHFLTETLLGMEYDATGGFRFYRLDVIPRYVFSLVRSKGYSFFFESLYVIHRNGF